jgi:hypothetical protein
VNPDWTGGNWIKRPDAEEPRIVFTWESEDCKLNLTARDLIDAHKDFHINLVESVPDRRRK